MGTMTDVYLSACCSAQMLLVDPKGDGDRIIADVMAGKVLNELEMAAMIRCVCEECKKPCARMLAVSHCCHEPVLLTKQQTFPFVCSRCEGDCELGDPVTPTHEDEVNAKILAVLRGHKDGTLEEGKAWKAICDLVTTERTWCQREIAWGLRDEMRRSLATQQRVPSAADAFMSGIEMALHRLNELVEDLFPNES